MLTVVSRQFFKRNRIFPIRIDCFIRQKTTQASVIRSKLPDIDLQDIFLGEYVWKNLDKWPEKTALVCFESGRSYTYYETYKKSKALAGFLRTSLRLQAGDVIAAVLPNLPEYAILILGAAEAGLQLTTVNPTYTADEIAKQFAISEPTVLFTTRKLWSALKLTGKRERMIVIVVKEQQDEGRPSETIDFDEACDEQHSEHVFTKLHSTNETILLPFSSGTTGLPKGVELTHRNIVSNLQQIHLPELRLNLDTEGSHQDVVPIILPMFHIYGLSVVLLNMITMGCKLITMRTFGSQPFKELLKHKPTIIFSVPPMVLMIANNPSIKGEDLSSIRVLTCGAAPLGVTDMQKISDKTKGKLNVFQAYGMTETSPMVLLQSSKVESAANLGGSGIVIPNTECKIVPEDDPLHPGLGIGQPGELLVKGPQVMKGYYKNQRATEQVLLKGGWLRTGDISHYDKDENFYITDRLKELIKVKGFQVAPAELEAVLRSHNAVVDAAVTGVPHPIHGEAPKGFVVLKNDVRVKTDDIQEFVAARVAAYKRLTGGIVVVDSIPKTASGKILRRILKNM